jgi:hypothetical protein
MIGKAGLGSFAKGILEYCYYEKELSETKRRQMTVEDVRGELVYVQHLAVKLLADKRLDLNYLSNQFLDNRDKNRRLTKFMWHQSFSFPAGENPTNDQITAIANTFAKDFGFDHNQMLVFKHTDTQHPHFHLVANRLDYNGKNTADHFNNYAKTAKFCRKMELELNLSIAPQMNLLLEDKRQTQDKRLLTLKDLIDHLLPEALTLEELKEKLLKKGYKTYIGRGIAFFNPKNRMKIKGSDLGRDYSLANLEKRIGIRQERSLKPVRVKEKKPGKRKGLGL